MFKRISLFFLLVFSISFSALKIDDKYIVDEHGNKVLAKEYNRLIITEPGIIEILFEIKGNDKIIAIGKTLKSKIFPNEEVEKLESIGNITNMNFEKLIEYKPDLVIINSMMLRDMERIKQMGYKILVSTTSNLNEILDLIEVMGTISGQVDNAKLLKEKSLEKLNKIKNFVNNDEKKLKGLILFSTNPMMASPDNSLPGDVLKHLGIQNLASGVSGARAILSPEYILKENPDFIAGAMSLESPKQIIEASNVILKTNAGKNNNIFILDSSAILRSSYRIFDEMEKLKVKLEKIKK